MLKNIRHKSIMDAIEADGYISTTDIADKFNISLATARRDLDELEEKGLLKKKYGGAEAVTRPQRTYKNFAYRKHHEHDEKIALAKEAAEMIPENAVIALGAGSTVYEVSAYLKDRSDLTIICSDIHSADRILSEGSGSRVYLIGGFLTQDGSSSCDFSEQLLERITSIDVLIMSSAGISLEDGMSSFVHEISELDRAFLKKAKKVVAVEDHTKFQVKAFYKICNLEDVDVLIVDDKVPADTVREIEARGISVRVAR